jgi:hypothetical protein
MSTMRSTIIILGLPMFCLAATPQSPPPEATEKVVASTQRTFRDKAAALQDLLKQAVDPNFQEAFPAAMRNLKGNAADSAEHAKVVKLLLEQTDRMLAPLAKYDGKGMLDLRAKIVAGNRQLAAQLEQQMQVSAEQAKAAPEKWRRVEMSLATSWGDLSAAYKLRADFWEKLPIEGSLSDLENARRVLGQIHDVLTRLQAALELLADHEAAMKQLLAIQTSIDSITQSLQVFSKTVLNDMIRGPVSATSQADPNTAPSVSGAA